MENMKKKKIKIKKYQKKEKIKIISLGSILNSLIYLICYYFFLTWYLTGRSRNRPIIITKDGYASK